MKPVVALRGLTAGAVSAAAVLGVLLGIGRRAGTAWRPLNAAAHALIAARADDVWTFSWGVTPAGVLVVLAAALVAGLVAASLAGRASWPRVIASCIIVAIAGYLLHVHVVARSGGGLAELLDIGELRALYTAAGIALAGGMRLAFLDYDATLDP